MNSTGVSAGRFRHYDYQCARCGTLRLSRPETARKEQGCGKVAHSCLAEEPLSYFAHMSGKWGKTAVERPWRADSEGREINLPSSAARGGKAQEEGGKEAECVKLL